MAAELISDGGGDASVDVSVVLPVYNEVGHIEKEILRIRQALDASPYTYEIVVVDDGSTDGSGELLRSIEGVRLLQFGQNRGSGSARKYGTQLARGRVVVWTDVDMTYPNDEIPHLVDALDGWDQVVGARRSEAGSAKFLRRPAKWFIRLLASYLTKTDIPDLNSGFRAFRGRVGAQFLYLVPRGFSCVTTITMAFLSNGYSVRYVPVDYFPRAGNSKFHWWRDSRRYLLQVVRMVLLYEPLRVFMPPAVVLFTVSAGKLIFDIFDKNWRVGTNTIMLFLAAAALAMIGMLADLLVQVNKRRHDVIPATAETLDRVA